nr:hypothetical protein [Tanacetum cinerariifolium]
YVPGPEHTPSPDYVPDPEHPPSPVEITYVPEPEYPEYLAPSDDEEPLKDQYLPADASPIAASPDYVADSDPKEDPKEDPEDDQADYPADGGDDPVLPAGDTKALEADEHTHTPRLPHIIIPLSQTRLCRAHKTVRPEPPMTDIPEAEVSPQKWACLTTSAFGFKVGKNSAAGATRQPGPIESDLRRYRVEQAGYGITNTDRPNHRRTAILMDREAMYAREAWASSEDRSSAIAAHVRTLEAQVDALIAQTSSLQTQLTMTLGRIEILKARDPEPQEGPAEAGSIC